MGWGIVATSALQSDEACDIVSTYKFGSWGRGADGGGGDGKIPRFDEILSTDAVGACNLIELLEECD